MDPVISAASAEGVSNTGKAMAVVMMASLVMFFISLDLSTMVVCTRVMPLQAACHSERDVFSPATMLSCSCGSVSWAKGLRK